MTLQTYCLRGDKVLNVESTKFIFSSPSHWIFVRQCSLLFLLYQSVRRISHKLTSSASKKDKWDFMQYVAFEFRRV